MINLNHVMVGAACMPLAAVVRHYLLHQGANLGYYPQSWTSLPPPCHYRMSLIPHLAGIAFGAFYVCAARPIAETIGQKKIQVDILTEKVGALLTRNLPSLGVHWDKKTGQMIRIALMIVLITSITYYDANSFTAPVENSAAKNARVLNAVINAFALSLFSTILMEKVGPSASLGLNMSHNTVMFVLHTYQVLAFCSHK